MALPAEAVAQLQTMMQSTTQVLADKFDNHSKEIVKRMDAMQEAQNEMKNLVDAQKKDNEEALKSVREELLAELTKQIVGVKLQLL